MENTVDHILESFLNSQRYTQHTREDEDVLQALDVVELREDCVDDARGVARLVAAPGECDR